MGSIQASYTKPGPDLRAPFAEFSLGRLIRLVNNRVLQDLIPLGIGAAIILGLNLLVMFFGEHNVFFNQTNGVLWTISLFGAAFILASTAFRDMQSGKSGTDWLLLPASALEKYLAALIELVIVMPLVALAGATALSALLAGGQTLLAGHSAPIWTPLEWNHPAIWGTYLVTTLLFLTGSAVFRKQALLKTLGMVTAFSVALSLLGFFGFWMLFQGGHVASSINLQIEGTQTSVLRVDGRPGPAWVTQAVALVWEIFYYGVTPVLAIVFGWLRVSEKEAKDAVQ